MDEKEFLVAFDASYCGRERLSLALAALAHSHELLRLLIIEHRFSYASIYRQLRASGVLSPAISYQIFVRALKLILARTDDAPAAPGAPRGPGAVPPPAAAPEIGSRPLLDCRCPGLRPRPAAPLAGQVALFTDHDELYPFYYHVPGAFGFDLQTRIVYGLKCCYPSDPRPWPILRWYVPCATLEENYFRVLDLHGGDRDGPAEQGYVRVSFREIEKACNDNLRDTGQCYGQDCFHTVPAGNRAAP